MEALRGKWSLLGASCGLLLLAASHLSAQAPRHPGFIDADERAFVIEEVTRRLYAHYLFPERAQRLEQVMRDRVASGAYDRLTRADQFVRALTHDLQAESGDKHLVVHFSAEPLPADLPMSPPAVPIQPQPVTEAQKELLGAFWRNESCSFANAAVLMGNVGYLKINAFPSPRVCGETTTAAMSVLADCRALIIDLRDNIGGDPAMVAYVSSYLFDAPVHLNDLHQGRTNETVQSWTTAVVAGRQFIGKPVFVLTSPRTFSAAEEFAYNLKMLGRATIVGERSGGGAHAALSLRIDSHFHVSIPFARSINPISHSNWEGKGVEPDVVVREDVAVHAAHRAALEGIVKQSLTVTQRATVQRHIEALTALLQKE